MFPRSFLAPTLCAGFVFTGVTLAQEPIDSFRPVTTFALPGGVAEIVDVTADGRTLIYTGSGRDELGVVDITDPIRPKVVATVPLDGEPTSVSVVGDRALATVWLDRPSVGDSPPAFQPGALVVVDLSSPSAPRVVGSCDIGFHPDSIKAVRRDGGIIAVIAIENEPVIVEMDAVIDDDRPGSPNDVSPSGLIQIVIVDTDEPADSKVVDVVLPEAVMSDAGLLYPGDPQPEFVAIHGDIAAVSLQENNGVALVDISDPHAPSLTRVFSTGIASDRQSDLLADGEIALVDTYPADVGAVKGADPGVDANGDPVLPGARMSDGVAFSPDGAVIYTADEGDMDYTGGRGFSGWSTSGRQTYDSGGLLECAAVELGLFPDARSDAKGIEIESIATGRFDDRDLAFVTSERGSFMAVFDIDDPCRPRLIQILPTGVSPEGVVAIESRGLVVTSDEIAGDLTIFRGQAGLYRPQEPSVPIELATSVVDRTGVQGELGRPSRP